MIPTTPWDATWKGVAEFEWFGIPVGPEMDKVLCFPPELLYGRDDLF